MKNLLIYSKKFNSSKISKLNDYSIPETYFIIPIIISGLIIGAASVIMSDELKEIVLSSSFFSISENSFIFIIKISVILFYIFFSFNPFGIIFIILIPFIFGIITGINSAVFLISADTADILKYLLYKIPSVSLFAVSILKLTLNAVNFSTSLFSIIILNSKANSDCKGYIIKSLKASSYIVFSIVFDIIYFCVNK